MDGLLIFAALDAAKQLRKAIVADLERRLEQCSKYLCRLPAEVEQCHAVGDQGIVMRPHRSTVIAERIERPFVMRERAQTPAREHAVAH